MRKYNPLALQLGKSVLWKVNFKKVNNSLLFWNFFFFFKFLKKNYRIFKTIITYKSSLKKINFESIRPLIVAELNIFETMVVERMSLLQKVCILRTRKPPFLEWKRFLGELAIQNLFFFRNNARILLSFFLFFYFFSFILRKFNRSSSIYVLYIKSLLKDYFRITSLSGFFEKSKIPCNIVVDNFESCRNTNTVFIQASQFFLKVKKKYLQRLYFLVYISISLSNPVLLYQALQYEFKYTRFFLFCLRLFFFSIKEVLSIFLNRPLIVIVRLTGRFHKKSRARIFWLTGGSAYFTEIAPAISSCKELQYLSRVLVTRYSVIGFRLWFFYHHLKL